MPWRAFWRTILCPAACTKSRSTILRMENIIMTRLWKKGWSGSDFLRGRIYPATTSWWTASWEPAIQAINRAKAYVVSVDINSGMNGDTGKGDLVVRSDLTVTIGYLKAGMFLGEAVWKVGRLVVADIGIRLVREDFFLATPEEMVFPRSGLSLQSSQVTMMTPGEAESVSKNGQTIPDVAQEIALRSQRLVRV